MKYFSSLLAIAFTGLLVSEAKSAAVMTALWEFEEISGGSATDSVASLGGNLSSGADLNVGGKFGSGIAFGADVTQAARMTTSTAAGHAATQQTGDFSILLWIRPTAADLTNTFNRLIDASSNIGAITTGYRLMTNSGGNTDNFQFLADSGPNTSIVHARNLTADTWTLLAVRYDIDGNATVNVLFDTDTVNAAFVLGNNQSVSANGAVVYASGENTNLGSMDSPTINSNEFEGRMDDAAFFSGLLTDAQIAMAFNSGAINAVPEPSSAMLLFGGILSLALFRRR